MLTGGQKGWESYQVKSLRAVRSMARSSPGTEGGWASQTGAPGPRTFRSSVTVATSPRGWGRRPTASSLVFQSCYPTTSQGSSSP